MKNTERQQEDPFSKNIILNHFDLAGPIAILFGRNEEMLSKNKLAENGEVSFITFRFIKHSSLHGNCSASHIQQAIACCDMLSEKFFTVPLLNSL